MIPLPPLPALIGYLVQGVAALLAGAVRRQKATHRPVYTYLAAWALIDPARFVLGTLRPHMHHPGTGWGRVLFQIDAGLFFACSAAILWLTTATLLPRLRYHALGVAFALIAIPTGVYPTGVEGEAYFLVELVAVSLSIVVAGAWFVEEGMEVFPTTTQVVALAYVACETVMLCTVYLADDIPAAWPLAWSGYMATHATVAICQTAWLLRQRRRRAIAGSGAGEQGQGPPSPLQ